MNSPLEGEGGSQLNPVVREELLTKLLHDDGMPRCSSKFPWGTVEFCISANPLDDGEDLDSGVPSFLLSIIGDSACCRCDQPERVWFTQIT